MEFAMKALIPIVAIYILEIIMAFLTLFLTEIPNEKELRKRVKIRLKRNTKKDDIEEFYTGLLSPKGIFIQCDYFDAENLCKTIITKYTDEMLGFDEAMKSIKKKGYIWIREVSIEYKKKKITKKQYKWFKEHIHLLNDEQAVDARNILFFYKNRK